MKKKIVVRLDSLGLSKCPECLKKHTKKVSKPSKYLSPQKLETLGVFNFNPYLYYDDGGRVAPYGTPGSIR